MPTPRIPDGQPMSRRTMYRRKREAGLTKPQQQYYVNEGIVDEWSDALAWIVGIIWSDGNLSGNTIEVCSKDFQLVDLLLSLVGGIYRPKNDGRHVRVYFTSRKVAQFLRDIGLTERKSLTVRWPTMPQEFEGSFMRGLIDGDGSVRTSMKRPGQQAPDLSIDVVTASDALKDGIGEWLTRNDIAHSWQLRTYPPEQGWNPLWRVIVRRQDSLRRLFPLLYIAPDAPCLHRKYAPYALWIDTPRGRAGRPAGQGHHSSTP